VPVYRNHGYKPPFSLSFGFRGGFSLVHTTLVLVSGRFGMFRDISGSAVNGRDSKFEIRNPDLDVRPPREDVRKRAAEREPAVHHVAQHLPRARAGRYPIVTPERAENK
jgi:hypothetical protein